MPDDRKQRIALFEYLLCPLIVVPELRMVGLQVKLGNSGALPLNVKDAPGSRPSDFLMYQTSPLILCSSSPPIEILNSKS